MDALIHRLREKLQKYPDSDTVRQALSACTALRDGSKDVEHEGAEEMVSRLHEEGLWDEDDKAAWDDWQKGLAMKTPFAQHDPDAKPSHEGEQQAADFIALPTKASPNLPFSFATPTALPMELYGLLDQAYYLHMLATEPQTVLPAGKSLLSALLRPHTERPATSVLHGRVEDMVHRAFWDEALESLSNPSPPVQLGRLKLLYGDLHITLSSLLQPDDPVLFTLSSHLSPTSSPLRSAIIHLREVLRSLKQRCAPARDPQIDALSQALDDPPDDALATTVVDTIRSILKLADELKDDLSQFVLGSMSEQQLQDVVAQQAANRERELVLQLWPQHALARLWQQWLDDVEVTPTDDGREPTHRKFVRRLMRALGTNHAVSCNLPAITVNLTPSGAVQFDPVPNEPPSAPAPPNGTLPPPLLFITPTLFYIQNYLQALVITTSLRALVRIPTTPAKRKAAPPHDDSDSGIDMSETGFLRRIWTLLKADIDGSDVRADSELKLVNLADEVVRISNMYGGTLDGGGGSGGGVGPEVETQLREAVDRTLKPTDPVFLLLQKRLVGALTVQLLDDGAGAAVPVVGAGVPREMRSGRAGPGKKVKLNMSVEDDDGGGRRRFGAFARERLGVKGFEHPVLADAVSEVLLMLRKCVAWTELVWPDLFDEGLETS